MTTLIVTEEEYGDIKNLLPKTSSVSEPSKLQLRDIKFVTTEEAEDFFGILLKKTSQRLLSK